MEMNAFLGYDRKLFRFRKAIINREVVNVIIRYKDSFIWLGLCGITAKSSLK